MSKNCPKKGKLNAVVAEEVLDEDSTSQVATMQIVTAIKSKSSSDSGTLIYVPFIVDKR